MKMYIWKLKYFLLSIVTSFHWNNNKFLLPTPSYKYHSYPAKAPSAKSNPYSLRRPQSNLPCSVRRSAPHKNYYYLFVFHIGVLYRQRFEIWKYLEIMKECRDRKKQQRRNDESINEMLESSRNGWMNGSGYNVSYVLWCGLRCKTMMMMAQT